MEKLSLPLVCLAYDFRREYPCLAELAGAAYLSEGNVVWPTQLLQAWTGTSEEECEAIMDQAATQDLVDYGTSVRSGWLTHAGQACLLASGLSVAPFLDEVFERGIPGDVIRAWPEARRQALSQELDRLDGVGAAPRSAPSSRGP